MKTKVLVVDDQIAVRRFVSKLLASAGHEVHQVSTGMEAVAAAKHNGFALLVSDIVLPGSSGIELVAKLRQAHPGMPAVLMSGDSSMAGRVRHITEKTTFLAKPFTSWELLGAVERLLHPEGGRVRAGETPMVESIPPSLNLEATPFESDGAVIYTLDPDLHIVSCNRSWNQFASSNGAIHLHRRSIKGMPLSDFIQGSLRSFYQRAFRFVLATGHTWQHEYECSSPEHLRKFAMTVYRVHDGLLVVNSLRAAEPHSRPRLAPQETAYRDTHGIIVMCSNCRRTRRVTQEQLWDWVPAFVERPLHPVSHGLCPPCSSKYAAAAVQ